MFLSILSTILLTGSLLIHTTPVTSYLSTYTPLLHENKSSFTFKELPSQKIITNDYYAKQSFNNCGPASLSMTLRYHNIVQDQETLANTLRPHRNPLGINDDKSVTMEELAQKAEEYNLLAYHRPAGTIKQMKQFLANDMPIITKEWLNEYEDIGHYRVLHGYDDTTQEVIQDDSYVGKDVRSSYGTFENLWRKFNYEYVVLVPKEKQQIAEAILGSDINTTHAWTKAVNNAQTILKEDPNDIDARFTLVVAYYNLGAYKQSVTEFEKIEDQLPVRTLWYQIEPIKAYFALGKYDKVFELTDEILQGDNKAFSELYFLRGRIHQIQGETAQAKIEFEQAVLYKKTFFDAQQALKEVQNKEG